MSAFNWLLREQAAVPLKKFFYFQAKPSSCLDETEAKFGALPQGYKDFVRRFGSAELFRHPGLRDYLVSVLAPPQVCKLVGEPTILRLGHFINTGFVCLKWQDSAFLDASALYTGDRWPVSRISGAFEEWLQRSCRHAKRLYSKAEWNFTLRPPIPFSSKETEIVRAIPLFKFQKVGITGAGSILIQVKNESPMQLPCLTIGVVLGEPARTCWYALPTGGVKPGTAATIDCSIYPGSALPEEIQLFRLPLPEPDDRPYYWELSNDQMLWNRLKKQWVRPSSNKSLDLP